MSQAPATNELLKMLTLDDILSESRSLAETIGIEPFIEMVKFHGGDSLYVPKPDKLAAYVRHRLIRGEFTGCNHEELARRWGLTVRSIYAIVKV